MSENPPKQPPQKRPNPAAKKPVLPQGKPVKKGKAPSKLTVPGLKKPIPLTMPVMIGAAVVGFVLFIVVVGLMGSGGMMGAAPVKQVAQEAPKAPIITAETDTEDTSTPVVPVPIEIPYAGPQGEANVPVLKPEIEAIKRVGDEIPPLKREVKSTRDEFYARSDLYEFEDLQGDKYLAYRVRLPKGWQNVGEVDLQAMQLNNRLLGVVTYFVSPPNLDQRSSFRIKAQKLAHMTSARDWLLQYALSNHYTLQAISDYGEDRAETIYIVTELDVSYVVRTVVLINGPRVMIAEYWVPNEIYQDQKDNQIWSVTSFHLKYKDDAPGEELKRFNFFDIATVDYPESWELQKGDIVSIEQMNASIVNIQDKDSKGKSRLLGRVDIYLFANNAGFTIESATRYIQEKVTADSLILGDQVAFFTPRANKHGLEILQSKVYKINNAENTYQDYQYWITIMRGKNYHFVVCLLQPPRPYNFYNWARNLSAYEFVMGALREGA